MRERVVVVAADPDDLVALDVDENAADGSADAAKAADRVHRTYLTCRLADRLSTSTLAEWRAGRKSLNSHWRHGGESVVFTHSPASSTLLPQTSTDSRFAPKV